MESTLGDIYKGDYQVVLTTEQHRIERHFNGNLFTFGIKCTDLQTQVLLSCTHFAHYVLLHQCMIFGSQQTVERLAHHILGLITKQTLKYWIEVLDATVGIDQRETRMGVIKNTCYPRLILLAHLLFTLTEQLSLTTNTTPLLCEADDQHDQKKEE